MEIDITWMMQESANMTMFFASIAEIGENAGPSTWHNALVYAERAPLLKPDQYPHAIKYLKTFGASWTDEELNDPQQLNALVIQLVAGDIREIEAYNSIEEYFADSENNSGRIFQSNDKFYYYLGD